jgi:hypothetical protein
MPLGRPVAALDLAVDMLDTLDFRLGGICKASELVHRAGRTQQS